MIPVADPGREVSALSAEIGTALDRVLRSGRYVLGEEVEAFEHEFAAYLGTPEAVGVANGTDALELAMRAVGCGPGTEVLTVANAGGYAASAAVAVGATPVYVEIDPATLMADAEDLAGRIGARTGAVVLTHLYGRIHPRVADVAEACRRTGVPLVEDCAQATGATLDGRHAGTFGTVATHSFYPTKNLGALGDAGAVTTADTSLAADVRALRQYGWSEPQVGRLRGGRNSRLDEVQAAVLRAKLPYLDDRVARRRSVADRYRSVAPSSRWIGAGAPSDAHHLCVLVVEDRDTFRREAQQAGIATAVHYPVPDHLQPSLPGADRPLEHTEAACRSVVSVPCHPFLTDDEVRRVQGLLSMAG